MCTQRDTKIYLGCTLNLGRVKIEAPELPEISTNSYSTRLSESLSVATICKVLKKIWLIRNNTQYKKITTSYSKVYENHTLAIFLLFFPAVMITSSIVSRTGELSLTSRIMTVMLTGLLVLPSDSPSFVSRANTCRKK